MHPVIPAIAVHDITGLAFPAVYDIVARPTAQEIFTAKTKDSVVTFRSVDKIAANSGIEKIVTSATRYSAAPMSKTCDTSQ